MTTFEYHYTMPRDADALPSYVALRGFNLGTVTAFTQHGNTITVITDQVQLTLYTRGEALYWKAPSRYGHRDEYTAFVDSIDLLVAAYPLRQRILAAMMSNEYGAANADASRLRFEAWHTGRVYEQLTGESFRSTSLRFPPVKKNEESDDQ
jgi:hypothetical protein